MNPQRSEELVNEAIQGVSTIIDDHAKSDTLDAIAHAIPLLSSEKAMMIADLAITEAYTIDDRSYKSDAFAAIAKAIVIHDPKKAAEIARTLNLRERCDTFTAMIKIIETSP